MVDRVEVEFGGTTTELDAAAARADAALKKLNAQVVGTNGSLSSLDGVTKKILSQYDSGYATLTKAQYAFQGIEEAVAEGAISAQTGARAYMGVAATAEKAAEGASMLGHGTAGVTRELIVLGHEAVSGNFSRMPGSMMVLAERMNLTNLATLGVTGAVIGLSAAVGYMIYSAYQANEEFRKFESNLALLGRSGDATRESFDRQVEAITRFKNVSVSSAREAVIALSGVTTLTQEQKDQIVALIPSWVMMRREVMDSDDAIKELIKAFEGGTGSLEKFGEQHTKWTAEQRAAMAAAKENNDTIGAQSNLLDALSGSLSGATNALQKYAAAFAASIKPGPRGPTPGTAPKPEMPTDNTGASAEEQQNEALIQAYNKRAVAIESAKSALARLVALSKESNLTDAEKARRLEAVKEAQEALDTVENKKSPGQASRLSELRQALAQEVADQAQSREQELSISRAYWSKVLQGEKLTAAERVTVKTTLANIEKEIGRGASEGALSQLKAREAAEKEGSIERVNLARQEVAAVSKLYGQQSTQYAEAQRNLTAAQKAYVAETMRTELEVNNAKREAALSNIDIAREEISEESKLKTISANEEAANLRKLENQKYQLELEGLRDRLRLEDLDLSGQAKVYSQMEIAARKHALAMKKITDKEVEDNKKRWASYMQPVNSAISSSITGMIQGTTTLKSAVSNLAQSVAGEFINLGVNMLTNWIATQLAMAVSSKTTAIGEVASNAAVAGSGAYAATAMIPYVGPALAPGAAATAYAGAMSYGALASAAGGWAQVPSDQIAQIHKDEMILPADIAGPVRDMAKKGSSGGDIHLHVSAIDAKSFADALSQNDGPIHKAVKKAQRNFQGSRFARA